MEEKNEYQQASQKLFSLKYTKIKCSRCGAKANMLVNDVEYCSKCYTDYYFPNEDLIEEYQDCKEALKRFESIKTEAKSLTTSNQINLSIVFQRLNRIDKRLTDQMNAKKL